MNTADLPLFAPAPVAEPEHVARLVALLDEAVDWRTAEEVLAHFGWLPTESNKRRVRAWASLTPKVISGQLGYRHLRHASSEEVHHCCARLEHQVKEVADRVGPHPPGISPARGMKTAPRNTEVRHGGANDGKL